jgi:hypothetical protein
LIANVNFLKVPRIAAQPQAQIKENIYAHIATSDVEHKVSSYKSSSPIAAQPQA